MATRPILLAALALCCSASNAPAFAQETDAPERPDEQPQAEPGEEEKTEEILITAPRTVPSDPSGSTELVAGEHLRQSARASTLEAVAQEVPWVYVSSRGVGLHGIAGGASGGITIRGMGGSPNTQVLVVLDGIPDYQGIFGHPLPDAYVPELLDHVQVLSGGDSVLYGTNAMAGVILLKSRWRTEPGSEFHLRSSAGSFESLCFQPSFLARWGSWDVAAAFHGSTSEGHRPGAGGDLQVGQMGARLWLSGSNRLSIRLKAAHIAGVDPGPLTHPHPDNWFDALRANAALEYERFSASASLRAAAFLSGGRHLLYDGFYSLDMVAGAMLEGRWQPGLAWELLGGLALDHVGGRVENRIQDASEPVAGLSNFALYQQVGFRPLEWLAFTVGARQIENPKYGFLFLYKAGASLSLWRGGRLRARWSTNFRQPTLRELSLPYPVANPELKPESSKNLDFGIEQRLGEHLQAEIAWFRTEATDLIKYFGSWPSATVVNIDHVIFYGLEWLARLRAPKYFEFMLGGTWLEVGRYTKQNPSLKLDGRVEFGYRALSLSLSGEYVHGLYQNNYGRDALPDVFFLDAQARYFFEQWGLAVFLIARNLTDSRYAFIDLYQMPGINVVAGLEVHL